MIDLEVNDGGSVFFRLGCEEFKNSRAYALSAMRAANEEFVDPGAPAAVFKAVVEGHDDVADAFVRRPQ